MSSTQLGRSELKLETQEVGVGAWTQKQIVFVWKCLNWAACRAKWCKLYAPAAGGWGSGGEFWDLSEKIAILAHSDQISYLFEAIWKN